MLEYMEQYCTSIRQDASGTYIAVLKPEYAIEGCRVLKCDNIRLDRWVTINGSHVLIGRDGRIASGMGGKLNGKKFGAWFNPKKKGPLKLPKSYGTGRSTGKLEAREENGNLVKVKGKKVHFPNAVARGTRNVPQSMRTTINVLNTKRHNKDFQGFANQVYNEFDKAPKGTLINVGDNIYKRTGNGWQNKSKKNSKEVNTTVLANVAMLGEGVQVLRYPRHPKFKFDNTPPKQESGAFNPNKLVDIRADRSIENHVPTNALIDFTKAWKNPPTVAQLLRRKKALKAVRDYVIGEQYDDMRLKNSKRGKEFRDRLEYFIDHSPRHTGTIHRAVDVSQEEFAKYQSLIQKGSAFGANKVTSWSSEPSTTGATTPNPKKPCKIIFTKAGGFNKSASVKDIADDYTTERNEGEVIVSKTTSMRVKRVLMTGPGYMQVEVEEV